MQNPVNPVGSEAVVIHLSSTCSGETIRPMRRSLCFLTCCSFKLQLFFFFVFCVLYDFFLKVLTFCSEFFLDRGGGMLSTERNNECHFMIVPLPPEASHQRAFLSFLVWSLSSSPCRGHLSVSVFGSIVVVPSQRSIPRRVTGRVCVFGGYLSLHYKMPHPCFFSTLT